MVVVIQVKGIVASERQSEQGNVVRRACRLQRCVDIYRIQRELL